MVKKRPETSNRSFFFLLMIAGIVLALLGGFLVLLLGPRFRLEGSLRGSPEDPVGETPFFEGIKQGN
jgi:hypothetical protein